MVLLDQLTCYPVPRGERGGACSWGRGLLCGLSVNSLGGVQTPGARDVGMSCNWSSSYHIVGVAQILGLTRFELPASFCLFSQALCPQKRCFVARSLHYESSRRGMGDAGGRLPRVKQGAAFLRSASSAGPLCGAPCSSPRASLTGRPLPLARTLPTAATTIMLTLDPIGLPKRGRIECSKCLTNNHQMVGIHSLPGPGSKLPNRKKNRRAHVSLHPNRCRMLSQQLQRAGGPSHCCRLSPVFTSWVVWGWCWCWY
jgi:hypothetical protein